MSIITARQTGSVVLVSLATGGSGYTSPPTVAFVGGGGAGAAAVAHMAGTAVESVVITASGTGYTGAPQVQFSGGGGTGAAASAFAYAGPRRPMAFFKGRFNDMYGVDGMGRGIRWDGETLQAEPIGITKPSVGPSMTASTAAGSKHVSGIQIVSSGVGYSSAPNVVFSGGTPTAAAVAKAEISNGRVTSVRVIDGGSGYQDAPTVELSGGIATGATLGVGVIGSVERVVITAQGTGYTGSPTLVFSAAQGLQQAVATCTVLDGKIADVRVLSGGTGITATGVTASITGGGGTGGQVAVRCAYRVNAVTVVGPGSGYRAPPIVTFRAAASDNDGSGAAATATVAGGSITAVTVHAGGSYAEPPTAVILDSTAKATATMSSSLTGEYKCCIRYLDDTPESRRGPIPSSISDLVAVDVPSGSASLTWTFAHEGIEPRVTAMELWRTTADQSVVLFRVATIQRSSPEFFDTYIDSLTDDQLKDTDRAGYGLMPVTLPSGQLNARRFGVPPGNFSVACMFQDRAWYSADTSGERPNSLMFSEVDEPESVPAENELVVQENSGEPDQIVALVPLGGALLICQSRHLYKLQYVAQPVLDASITLVGYRGILNNRCWDLLGGVAFIADSYGMYAFDGGQEEAISVPIDNFWRDGVINFAASASFHVRADQGSKVVRFFYCRGGESLPTRALCYCVTTKAWWEETYPMPITASAVGEVGGKQDELLATGSGTFVTQSGSVDSGNTPIPYLLQTGNFVLGAATADAGSRAVSVLYEPTVSDSHLKLRLHYNNSPTPRQSAIADDRGGFVTTSGATEASLNMKKTRSALGDSNGFARASFSGHRDDRNVGGDRHVAIAVAGTQASTSSLDAVKVYAVTISGAG